MAIVRADGVFSVAAGFSEGEIVRILAVGQGKTISFRGGPGGRGGQEAEERRTRVLTEYAQGKTADEIAARHGKSRRQVFYLVRREREGTEETQGTKVTRWRNRGLSWREVGRLLGVSHEQARQMGNGGVDRADAVDRVDGGAQMPE